MSAPVEGVGVAVDGVGVEEACDGIDADGGAVVIGGVSWADGEGCVVVQVDGDIGLEFGVEVGVGLGVEA